MIAEHRAGVRAISHRDRPLQADQEIQLRYHYVEFLTEHLSDCCRVFGGDLQEMLVLAVIGQVHLRAMLDPGPDGTVKPRTHPASTGINTSRIADVTGIPRQTVRRKLAKLQTRGWVAPQSSGRWTLAVKAGVVQALDGGGGVEALDSRSMERVLRLARQLGRIIPGT
jgi:hypothetical protein